jgi:hypothetical protein
MLHLPKMFRVRGGRVWFDEDLPASYDAERVVDYIQDADPAAQESHAQRAGIEISHGRFGHESTYALLGADWSPDESGQFHAQIFVRDGATRFQDSLSDGGNALVGLPNEFCDAVKLGLKESVTPSGTLIIRYAAHSPVGSSPFLFRWASRALMLLFATSDRSGNAIGSLLLKCEPEL